MTNDTFLESLSKSGWTVRNRIAFVRLGGKFQTPVRRNHSLIHSNSRCDKGELTFRSTDLNYEHSQLGVSDDWHCVLAALEVALPKWLSSQTPQMLKQQIAEYGEDAYIERLWLEDLAPA